MLGKSQSNAGARVPLTTLISEISRLQDSYLDQLSRLVTLYGNEFAFMLIEELQNKLSEKFSHTQDKDNHFSTKINSNVDLPWSVGSAEHNGSSSPQSNAALTDTGLVSRDLPERHKTHRQLRKALIENIMLIYFARNPAGVVSSDLARELARLGLSEPTGTMRSRISKMRDDKLLKGDAGFGNYAISKEGFDLAKKAIARYGFQIELPAFPENVDEKPAA